MKNIKIILLAILILIVVFLGMKWESTRVKKPPSLHPMFNLESPEWIPFLN
jgi:hypothetical protein